MDQIMNQIMGMSGTEKSEYVRYATISVLSDCDKKSYNMDNALKSPKLCQECGIIYFTSISSKCPLCAMKEMFLSSHAIGTEIEKKGKSQQLHNYKKGDIIKLGKCAGLSVEWTVLDTEATRVLLLANDVLDVKPYCSSTYIKTTWAESSLRKYLNDVLYKEVFSDEEREKIESVKLDNENKEKELDIDGAGESDKVFCLSVEEAEKYFQNDSERKAKATDYAKSKVGEDALTYFIYEKTGTARWWLRSQATDSGTAATIGGAGWINYEGIYVNNLSVGVRPALWMKC